MKSSGRSWLALGLATLVGLIVFGSQYVRRLAIEPGPCRETAVVLLSLTDSPDYQWLTVTCVGVYFLALTVLGSRRLADETNTGVPTVRTAWRPEWLLLLFVAAAAGAYAFGYQKARFHSDFLALLTGITIARAVGVVRERRLRAGHMGFPGTVVMPVMVGLLTAAALVHPDMGKSFRYRDHTRWIGPYSNPNTFGLLMGMGLVLAAGQAALAFRRCRTGGKDRTARIALVSCGICAAVLSLGLLRSYSRGAWMGTALGMGYLAFAAARWRRARRGSRTLPTPAVRTWPQFVPGALVIFCALLVLGFWNFRQTENRLVRRVFSIGNANDFSWRNRLTAWVGALQMMGDRPWVGFGWNRVETVYDDAYRVPSLAEPSAVTLNDYSVLGVTLGLPAVACMLGYLARKFAAGHRSYFGSRGGISPTDWQMATCRAGFVVAFAGCAVERGIFYIALGAPFWLLLELGSAPPIPKLHSDPSPEGLCEIEEVPDGSRPNQPEKSGPLPLENSAASMSPGAWVRRSAVVLVAIASLVGPGIWLFFKHRNSEPNDPSYRRILSYFQSAQPMAVSVSPDGRLVLQKAETAAGFRLTIWDRASSRERVSSLSRHTQRALTWQPNSRALAYQAGPGMDRALYLLEVDSGRTTKLNAPESQTALTPLRWSADGRRIAYFQGDWRTGRLLAFDTRDAKLTVVSDLLSANCDFSWSPDGQRLAFVTETEPGSIVASDLAGEDPAQLVPREGATIRALAWSPEANSMLATIRGDTDEYFKLFEVDTKTGQATLRAEADGDIEHPVWLPGGGFFVYHALSNGMTVAVLGNRKNPHLKILGPTEGVIQVTHAPESGKIFARYASLRTAPALLEIPLDGDPSVMWAPPNSDESKCPTPEFLRLKSRDGTLIPAYHWRSNTGGSPARAALIVLHGGLRTQTYPTWEAYLKLMLDHSCDVLAVNYRGSSGHGQTFERMGGDRERIQDILGATDFAVDQLKVPSRRVYLLGISHGAGLAAAAAAQGAEIGGLILVSWIRPGVEDPPRFHTPFKVIEFHGASDPTLSAHEARKTVRAFFASASSLPPVQFRVFADEGHFFYQTRSWARVYWEILRLMEAD